MSTNFAQVKVGEKKSENIIFDKMKFNVGEVVVCIKPFKKRYTPTVPICGNSYIIAIATTHYLYVTNPEMEEDGWNVDHFAYLTDWIEATSALCVLKKELNINSNNKNT